MEKVPTKGRERELTGGPETVLTIAMEEVLTLPMENLLDIHTQNAGVVTALSEALGSPVATHPDSQLCGAIGAALLGLQGLKR